ncbi:MAG: hypothetical protein H6716_20840 [Polyangiaceae bacterium]|nr:hypothetical protein [Polyangiaceae bacterium]
MKKFIVPVVCALVGCAAGVAMPAITAQTYGASPPGVQRWENYCAFEEVRERSGDLHREANRVSWNQVLRVLGSQGWEFVGAVDAAGAHTPCFRRPAQ